MVNKKYKELLYKGKTITEKYLIEEILVKEKMSWFIDAETSDVRLEILNDTLIFNGGIWYNGIWKYGAFRGGEWRYGTWQNGVWFNGTWYNGRFENGIIFNGNFLQGEIQIAKIRQENQDGTPTTQNFVDCKLSQNVKKV